MPDRLILQSYDRSKVDRSRLVSLDIETLDDATYPLLHQEARILYILSGEGVIELQGNNFQLSAGTVLAMLPWQVSNVIRVTKPLQFYTVIYDLQVFNTFFNLFPQTDGEHISFIEEVSRSPLIYLNEIQQRWTLDFFVRLQHEVGLESEWEAEKPKALRSLAAMTLLLNFAVKLIRFAREGEMPPLKEDNRDLKEVFRYMYLHTEDKLTQEGLARMFFVSESALRSYIKNMTGMSFYELLNEMRLSKVSSYLLHTNMTLEEISLTVGFWDASHISHVFSEYMGMPVSDYRKTYQRLDTLPRVEDGRLGYRLAEYLARHYSEELTPKQVAEHFGISVPEMNRLLLIHTSRNYEDFLNYIRISRADRLLLETNMTVTDIAAEVGYQSVKTFNRNFFRLHTVAPSDFRKSITLQPKKLGRAAAGEEET